MFVLTCLFCVQFCWTAINYCPKNTKNGFHGTNIDFNKINDQSLLKRNFQTYVFFWKSILNQNQKLRTQIFDFFALKMICCMNSSLPITLS